MSGKVKDGDYVVAHRINPDGLYEATCKQYRLVDGEMWLAPDRTTEATCPLKGTTLATVFRWKLSQSWAGFMRQWRLQHVSEGT